MAMIARRIISSPFARQTVAALGHPGSSLPRPAIRCSSTASAPVTIADGSFWRSLVPRPLRREDKSNGKGVAAKGAAPRREWNPATYFIVMFLFIGSMSIQMLALRHQTERYLRQSSLRIEQLREVVRRIQNGEDVDVEKVLGTGDPQKEAEWEEVLRAIERDDAMRKPQQQQQQQQQQGEGRKDSTSQTNVKLAPHGEEARQQKQPTKTKPANFGSFF